MSEKSERKRKKKDDDEFHLDPTPTRRKNSRKGKTEKKNHNHNHNNHQNNSNNNSNQTGSDSFLEQIPLGPVPIIPLNSVNEAENIEEEDMRDCYDLLVKFMNMPVAEPFLEPVNYLKLDLPQYPEIIKKPMDLGTIKKMLQHGCLEHPGHFADHVRLVFKNAIDFNQPESSIYNTSESLLQQFDEAFNLLCEKWNNETDPLVEGKEEDKREIDTEEKDKQEIEELQKNINSMKTNIANLKKQIDQIKSSKKKQSKLKSFRLTAPKTLLTYKEKEELCRLITENLDPLDLPELLKIIQSANPSYGNGGGDDGEFEIDIERIDDITLLDVKKYVERCTQINSKRRNGRASRTRRAQSDNQVVDKEQIERASIQTTQRINAISKQILDIKSQI